MADPKSTSPPSNRLRSLLIFSVLLLALAGAIVFPPSFRFFTGKMLRFEAARHGLRLSFADLRGSIFEPFLINGAELSSASGAGSVLHLTAEQVRLTFAWKNLFFNRSARVWKELAIDRLQGSLDLPTAGSPKSVSKASGKTASKGRRMIFPSLIDLQDADFIVRQGEDFVHFEHAAFRASDLEAGGLRIGALALRQPWLTTSFADLHGTIGLQDDRLALADLKIGDTLEIENASADLAELVRGRLKMDFALAAFGGAIRGELRSAPRDQHLNFESIGTFSQISIAQLAAFFHQDADGAIKEGKFTFRGAPRDLAKATFSTRFEATNFRWGKRQWNSLVLGATLINRRLMIPELQLQQAHNSLTLKGEMALPSDGGSGWQNDFDFTVAANIGNLTELSALLGPGLANTAGELTIDGAVRGQKQSFNGQLTISGAHLSYGSAPLDKLQAAVKITGNELQITNAELVHGSDFVRGHGVVNILGEKRYWGELKASVADLALYSAFLQPPITPAALAGGLMVDWSGDGTAQAHSGAFTAQLRKIRPLLDANAHPLDLEAEGTYSPANIFFSKFALSDGDTKLSARLIANPKSVTLQTLRLTHDKETWLQGDAELPLNVWAGWLNPGSAAWWNFESPCQIQLTAQNLRLRETLLLSGQDRPWRGEINGQLTSAGTLASLTMTGQAQLRKLSGPLAGNMVKTTDADLVFHGQSVELKNWRGTVDDLDFTADGSVQLGDVRTPQLALALHFLSLPLTLNSSLQVETAADLRIAGAPDTASVTGDVRLLSAQLERRLELARLIAPGSLGFNQPLESISLALIPFPNWQLDLTVTGTAMLNVTNSSGSVSPRLRLTGTPTAPVFSGEIEVANMIIPDVAIPLTIESASLFFNASHPWPPALFAELKGRHFGRVFDGFVFGTAEEKQFVWDSNSGLTEEEIRGWLASVPRATDLDASFREQPLTLAPAATVVSEKAPAIWPGFPPDS